jgi:hypothetical protein
MLRFENFQPFITAWNKLLNNPFVFFLENEEIKSFSKTDLRRELNKCIYSVIESS